MRIVFQDARIAYGISVPEFFITHLGSARMVTPTTVALTMCQEEGGALIPIVKTIWPIDAMMVVNPSLARRCMGDLRLA
jgi:hypothetical protein